MLSVMLFFVRNNCTVMAVNIYSACFDMSKNLKIVVCGSEGRMGRAVRAEIDKTQGFEFAGGVESGDSPERFAELLRDASLVIDFSFKDASPVFAESCAAAGIPFLCGVTGLSEEQMNRLKEAGTRIPVLWSPNMSPAVNIMTAVSGYIARKLPGFDIHIHEIHHTAKKDAPSGTALNIARHIKHETGKEPAMTSARIGGVTGVHSICFGGQYETLEFVHRAGSRPLFAAGALMAAEWLAGCAPGFYNYSDFLNLKELEF